MGIFSFLSKGTKEYQAVRSEMLLIEDELSGISRELIGDSSNDVIQMALRLLEQNKNRGKDLLDLGNGNAKVVAYDMIAYCLDNELVSGRNHIYRGMLNMTGEVYYHYYQYVLNQLERCGHLTNDEKQRNLDIVNREISEVG